jgi:hypothetical protein
MFAREGHAWFSLAARTRSGIAGSAGPSPGVFMTWRGFEKPERLALPRWEDDGGIAKDVTIFFPRSLFHMGEN